MAAPRKAVPAERRAEVRRPLHPNWLPSLEVVLRVYTDGFAVARVLALYAAAQQGRTLRRWGDQTFVRWYEEALRAGKLASARTGMHASGGRDRRPSPLVVPPEGGTLSR